MAGCEKEGNSDSMSLVPGVGPKDITMPTHSRDVAGEMCSEEMYLDRAPKAK